MRYMIVSSIDKSQIHAKVEDALEDGWELHGGVAISLIDGHIMFAQALIKGQPSQCVASGDPH